MPSNKVTPPQAIFLILKSDQDVKQLIGDRIFPGVAPEGTEDGWITYSRISGQGSPSHSGNGDLQRPRFQITGWSLDPAKRETIRTVVMAALEAKEYDLPDGNTAVFLYDDDRDLEDAGPPKRFGAAMDYFVWI